MEMQGIKRMRGGKAEGFREQQNINAKERQRRRNGGEEKLCLDERGENGMGRKERSEEEKETWKVTAAQTQKRE